MSVDLRDNEVSMTVEAIKDAISELPAGEKVALASWLNLQTMDGWDKEMAADFSPDGPGQHVVERIKSEIRAGKFRPMRESRPRTAE